MEVVEKVSALVWEILGIKMSSYVLPPNHVGKKSASNVGGKTVHL